MKIALDAMGGDAAPETTVAGAIRAAREFSAEIVLVGQRDAIEQALTSYPQRPQNLSIIHAPEVVGMEESAAASIRKKRDSSIAIGVGLLNVGEEETKGTDFMKETYGMLEGSGVNFVGNVEGHDIFTGEFDVIVCDGFAGNVALKTAESLANAISLLLKRSLAMSPITRLGAWLARDAFVKLRKEIDYAEHGGAPLLGVDGVSIIAHGVSGGKAIKNAIRVAYESVRHELNRNMVDAVNLYTQHARS